MNLFFSFIFYPHFNIHVHIICHNHIPVVYKTYYFTHKRKNPSTTRVFLYTNTHTHTCSPHTHTHTHPHAPPHTRTDTHASTHTHAHTHTHLYTHTPHLHSNSLFYVSKHQAFVICIKSWTCYKLNGNTWSGQKYDCKSLLI